MKTTAKGLMALILVLATMAASAHGENSRDSVALRTEYANLKARLARIDRDAATFRSLLGQSGVVFVYNAYGRNQWHTLSVSQTDRWILSYAPTTAEYHEYWRRVRAAHATRYGEIRDRIVPAFGAERRRIQARMRQIESALRSLVTVPHMTGQHYSRAKQALAALGLNVRWVESTTADRGRHGTIMAQSPCVGARIARGSTVTLTWYKYKKHDTLDTVWVMKPGYPKARTSVNKNGPGRLEQATFDGANNFRYVVRKTAGGKVICDWQFDLCAWYSLPKVIKPGVSYTVGLMAHMAGSKRTGYHGATLTMKSMNFEVKQTGGPRGRFGGRRVHVGSSDINVKTLKRTFSLTPVDNAGSLKMTLVGPLGTYWEAHWELKKR